MRRGQHDGGRVGMRRPRNTTRGRGRLNQQKIAAKSSWRASAYVCKLRRTTNTSTSATLNILVLQFQQKQQHTTPPSPLQKVSKIISTVTPTLKMKSNKKKKRVWFPVSNDGEPHQLNPDDGFGGSMYELETIVHVYYYTDDGTVLEGKKARVAAREERVARNKHQTSDLVYREFSKSVEKGGLGNSWSLLETELDKLEEPCWSIVGQLWRRLHGDKPRLEENACT